MTPRGRARVLQVANAERLNEAIKYERDFTFDYFGYKTLEKVRPIVRPPRRALGAEPREGGGGLAVASAAALQQRR